jgi:ring-1,2-phenylacetyl-CoA epoxidase subunit PaaC
VSAQVTARTDAETVLAIADDELVLGWRNSEWTGIAPFLEEDVAFSSIAQGEIGHARALYELVAEELGTTADELAFGRRPDEYRCAQLVEFRFVPDWARTIARHYLYETADAIRIAALKQTDSAVLAGLAAKIEREEAYHLMHARMWADRLRGEPRFQKAVAELWPYALAVLSEDLRPRLVEATGLPRLSEPAPGERGSHEPDWPALWKEMTMVRRLVPGGQW